MTQVRGWTVDFAKLGASMLRVAFLPPGVEGVEPSFAVRDPGAFDPVRPRRRDGRLSFESGGVSVSVVEDGRPPSRRNLEISWTQGATAYRWRPGDIDPDNLGGVYLALDLMREGLVGDTVRPYDPMRGFDAHMVSPVHLLDGIKRRLAERLPREKAEKKAHEEYGRFAEGKRPRAFRGGLPEDLAELGAAVRSIPPGFLSARGLSIIRDDSLPWDAEAGWPLPRPATAPVVLYILKYGHDFAAGLRALTRLLGPIPRPPDWVLGTWFSCYRKMGEKDFRRVHEDFRSRDLPLDVVVVDTDWHREFWHGFDWNTRLFPDPDRFAAWLREAGLRAAFNVHPAWIPTRDSRLPEFLRRAGVDPDPHDIDRAPTFFQENCHPVDLFDRHQARLYFDIFHRPIERQGCDMWWVDGGLPDPATRRDESAYLNELYSTRGRPGARPRTTGRTNLVLSRTAGLGAHRSTLHFTGDTVGSWKILELEVRLTPLAANVLLAYSSHDIGGFYPGPLYAKGNKPPVDLMVRWAQYGALSPILRFHSDHGIREPWRFGGRALAIIRRFLHLRRDLQPLLRRLAREAHGTGVSLARPLYYTFPNEAEAWCWPLVYTLGEEVLVAPVTRPDGRTTYWVPPGRWRHLLRERRITGPCVMEEFVPLEEMPVYRREE